LAIFSSFHPYISLLSLDSGDSRRLSTLSPYHSNTSLDFPWI
jgi:hypothetical protein